MTEQTPQQRSAADLAVIAMVVPMCEYLGREGLAYFQGVLDAGNGSLTAANLMLHGGHGMRVRNKMREILGYPDESTLPEHFYDNNWESLVMLCLDHAAKQNCQICDGTGLVRPIVPGELHNPVEPCICCTKGRNL